MYWCAFWYCPWNSTAFIYIDVHSGTTRRTALWCAFRDRPWWSVSVFAARRLCVTLEQIDRRQQGWLSVRWDLARGARSVLMSTASLVARQRTLVAWARFACCLGIVRAFKLSFSTEKKNIFWVRCCSVSMGSCPFSELVARWNPPAWTESDVVVFCNRKGSWLCRHIMWEGRVVAVAFTAL